MSMLKVPSGLTKKQKGVVTKYKKGAAKGQKKSTKRIALTGRPPVPSKRMPKGISRKKR